MVFLKVIEGADSGHALELKKAKTIIGRHPDCDIEVTLPAASRHHAQIVCVGDDYFLEDLHSRNGTFLNDEPVQTRTKLQAGDVIRVAASAFLFELSPSAGGADGAAGALKPIRTFMVDDDASSSLIFVSQVDAPSHGSQGTNLSAEALEKQLEALTHITQRVQRVLELDKVLPEILDGLFVIFAPAERGFVVLQNENGDFKTRWAKLRDPDSGDAIAVSRTIVRRVMESQQAILSADAADDERFALSKSLAKVSIRSMMCAPLIDRYGKSYGALQIDTIGDRDRFREADLRLLCSVASQASIAIENAQQHELALRQQAFERELELARLIQRSFLPKDSPYLPGYVFFDYYQPANHVGGDFYDYIFLPDGRMGIVVADVVGHGVPAAMLTAKLASDIRYQLLISRRPVDAINALNNSLSRDLVEDHFVTLVLAVLTPGTGEVAIVTAGHVPPLHATRDGDVVDIGTVESGWPLGIEPDVEYQQYELQLDRGEVVALYTDGVNESVNAEGEMFGIERIREQVRAAPEDLSKLGQSIIDNIRTYVRGSAQGDDMCLILIARE